MTTIVSNEAGDVDIAVPSKIIFSPSSKSCSSSKIILASKPDASWVPNSNSNDSWKVPSCSCFTLTTFSNVVSRTLVEESKALTVPVCEVKVLLTANVPDTSFKTKWALNVKSGGLVSL